MVNMCDNNLTIIGERVKEFADEFIDEEISVDGKHYEPTIIKLYNYTEHEPIPTEIYSWSLHEDEIVIDFETRWSPPCDWLREIATHYTDLQFELRYAEQGADFSGYIEIENGDVIFQKEDRSGVYYGFSYCEYCENDIHYQDFFDDEYSCCDECLININTARDTISEYIRKKKLKQLKKRLALMRMGRNRIMDNYLMRKVFIKRIYQESMA